MTANEELEKLSGDPFTPYWVQSIIQQGLRKDCVDAANALEHVAGLFVRRAAEINGGK